MTSPHWTPKLLELSKRIRPLRDRVLVSRIEYLHPTLYVAGVTLNKGLVIAVGYGRRRRRKTKFEAGYGMRAQEFEDGAETGVIRPMRVKVGDHVEFGSRMGFEFRFEGVDLLMLWEQSIFWTTNASQSQAALWQQSAGYDRNGNFMSGAEAAF